MAYYERVKDYFGDTKDPRDLKEQAKIKKAITKTKEAINLPVLKEDFKRAFGMETNEQKREKAEKNERKYNQLRREKINTVEYGHPHPARLTQGVLSDKMKEAKAKKAAKNKQE
jgi:hypothetical protein